MSRKLRHKVNRYVRYVNIVNIVVISIIYYSASKYTLSIWVLKDKAVVIYASVLPSIYV